MITWNVEALEYDDTDSAFPKRVNAIHLRAKHSAGPVHTLSFEVPDPQEGDTYVTFENITEEWALNLWKLYHSHPNMVLFCNLKMTDKLIFQGLLNFSLGHNSLSDDFNLWT